MRASLAPLVLLLLTASSCAGGAHTRPARTAGSAAPVPTRLAAGCDRFASPRGHDRWRGGRRHPFRTVKRLARSLRRGRTGCLAPGFYRHRGVARLRSPGVTLRSLRRRRARVDGTIWITGRARGVRVSRIRLTTHDPVYTIPLKVQADSVRISGNSITSSVSTSCVLVGSERTTSHTVIADNRIRHCGRAGKHDHLIYLQRTRGAMVRSNLLTDNRGGWAVHLYSDADNTLIERNIMDGNMGGVVFAGDGTGSTSDWNEARNNAITGSGPRWNIEGSWSGGPLGVGNTAHHNCLYSTAQPDGGVEPADGFDVRSNTVLSQLPYSGPRDYGFRRRSPCATLVGRVAVRSRGR